MPRLEAGLAFLQGLTNQGIDYLLLSNFDLECEPGVCCDLDICIPNSEKEDFLDYISSVGFCERRKPAELPGHHFYIPRDASLGFYLDVQYKLNFVDVIGAQEYVLSQPLDSFLDNRELVDGYLRPSPMDSFTLYIAKCMWQKKKIKPRNIDYIWDLGRSVQKNERVESVIGIDFLSQSSSVVLSDVFAAFRDGVRHFSKTLSLQRGEVRPDSPPPGLFVLFLGPDGAGKSSLIKGVESLSPIKCMTAYLGMGEGGWRLPLVKYFRKSRSRVFGYIFWYILLPLELIIRHQAAKRSSKWCIHLVDRFPGRPFIMGGLCEKLYRAILPVPDLIVILTGDPRVIAERKPNETSIDRTRSEFAKWDKVAERFLAPVIIVDTTVSSELDCSIAVLQGISHLSSYQSNYILDLKVRK